MPPIVELCRGPHPTRSTARTAGKDVLERKGALNLVHIADEAAKHHAKGPNDLC